MINNIDKYIESLFEQLLQCTADYFSFQYFYDTDEKLSLSENELKLQIFVEFIYRCLKCGLLKLDNGYEEYDTDGVIIAKFNSLEEFVSELAKRPLSSAKLDDLNISLWIVEQVYATELLCRIAKDCNLVAYVDDIDFNDPRSQKFREAIERVFAENGLPWDLNHLLFSIPKS